MLIIPDISPHSASKSDHPRLSRTPSENICLPIQLRTIVPDCALSCLQNFVLNNYSSHPCSSTAELSFLCTNPTLSGLTIGEGSLQCVVSTCPSFNVQTQSGYTICDGMADAIPNLAGTITATISAIATLTTGEPALSTSSALSFTATSATTTEFLTSTTPYLTLGETTSFSPYVVSTALSKGFSSSRFSSPLVPVPSTLTSTRISTSISKASQSTLATSSVSSGSKTSTIQSSASSSGSSAAINLPAEKSTLSMSTIAGIATASVIVIALALGYLAYLLAVKRKGKRDRRSQRFSSVFPPSDKNGSAGNGPANVEPYNSAPAGSERRFYAGEAQVPHRSSLWYHSTIAPSEIGVAVSHNTYAKQERVNAVSGRKPSQPYLTLFPVQKQPRGRIHRDRWSARSSFEEEDLEAQSQDVPILASPKSRSSARSFSSISIPRPAPLRLSKVKPDVPQIRNHRISLTPVYDNGNFESTTRQAAEDDVIHADSSEEEMKASNGHIPKSSSQVEIGRLSPQNWHFSQRLPIKAAIDARKKSETSARSVSVYTEIEEDDTPEAEVDRQLAIPESKANPRKPLRDLAWPQIPRSASIARQAEKPHSPRKDFVPGRFDPAMLRENISTHTQKMPDLQNNDNSSTTIQTQSSLWPVSSLPPRQDTRARVKNYLIEEDPGAYKTASNSVMTVARTHRPGEAVPQSNIQSLPRTPGQTYQGIQGLRSGRSLPRPYLPAPPIPLRSNFRGNVTPMTASNGDRYLKVTNPGT